MMLLTLQLCAVVAKSAHQRPAGHITICIHMLACQLRPVPLFSCLSVMFFHGPQRIRLLPCADKAYEKVRGGFSEKRLHYHANRCNDLDRSIVPILRITWRAFKNIDCWAPPTAFLIQLVCSRRLRIRPSNSFPDDMETAGPGPPLWECWE